MNRLCHLDKTLCPRALGVLIYNTVSKKALEQTGMCAKGRLCHFLAVPLGALLHFSEP